MECGNAVGFYLIALDLDSAKDGTVKEAWSVEVGPLFQFKTNRWSAGPSATPTVDGNLIFALGGNGDLVCVNAETGKKVWEKNLPKDLSAQVNPIGGGPRNLGWGFTWSPLVDGDQLVCVPGGPKGTVAALEKKTGKLNWQSAEAKDQATYTSPMLAEIGGVRQYVVLTNQGLLGVAAKDGKLLWRTTRKPAYRTEVVNSPIVHGDLIYTTVGGADGCELVKVSKDGDRFKAEIVYANTNMANHHGNVIRLGEYVYGFSQKGWVCQNFKDGKVAFAQRVRLASSLVYADGHVYCYSENDGTVVLVAADPKSWTESGRFQIPQQSKLRKPMGKVWAPPVIANGKLYLRDQELLFCFDVKAK